MEKWKQKSGVDFSPTSSTRKAGILAVSLYPVLYTHPIMKALCETTLLCLAPEWIDCVSLVAELMGFIAVSSYSGIPFNPCSLSLWRSGLYMPHEPRLVSWMLYGYGKKKRRETWEERSPSGDADVRSLRKGQGKVTSWRGGRNISPLGWHLHSQSAAR